LTEDAHSPGCDLLTMAIPECYDDVNYDIVMQFFTVCNPSSSDWMLCSIYCYNTSEECALKDVDDNEDPAVNIKGILDIDVVALMYQKAMKFPDVAILA
jgi:hypothetical protein